MLWHLWLWAPQVAEAHVAIQIGDWLFEETVAIPGPEQSYNPSCMAPKDFLLGTPVVFHLHNHGVNSWRLLKIEVAALKGSAVSTQARGCRQRRPTP